MAQDLIRDGHLDRNAAAEALRKFLEEMVRAIGSNPCHNVVSLASQRQMASFAANSAELGVNATGNGTGI